MAWIESHQRLANHPKVIRLARVLKISKAQAIGHLHLLWWWTLDYSPTGELSAFTSCELGGAAEWTGDADFWLAAMIECGWIDKEPLRIHDWYDFAGKLLERRKKDADYQKKKRRHDVGTTSASTVPYRTVPNQETDSLAREANSDFSENGAFEEKPPQTPLVSKEIERAGNGSPPPVKNEPCPSSGETAGVPSEIHDALFRLTGSLVHENTARAWLADHPPDRILRAILAAEGAGKRDLRYISGILSRWARDGEPEEKQHVRPRRGTKPDRQPGAEGGGEDPFAGIVKQSGG